MRKIRRRTSSYLVQLEPEQLAQLQLQLRAPPGPPRPPAPTFAKLFERFIAWSKSQRQKPSTIETKEGLWRVHLVELLGERRVDALTPADVERVRALKLSAKRVNNALSVVRKMLRLAVKWGELERLPCELEPVTEVEPEYSFYEFDAYAHLVAAAGRTELRQLLVVLLGGDAGLRMGEMLGLQRGDVDLGRAALRVRRAAWRGELVAPKGGRARTVDLTKLLRDALEVLFGRGKHQRSDARVLVDELGRPLSVERIRTLLRRAQRAGGLEPKGNLHVLRHTFCSHLAMRGAPAIAIKALAGHSSITTTERYMHLAEGQRQGAVALLDRARAARSADLEAAQRSTTIGHSPVPHSNAGVDHQPAVPQEASGTTRAALTPTRFELVRGDQAEWLEQLLGPPKRT